MRALAVIGANYGDEGKGLITDYLCATRGVDIVVRHNGGAQAGHTVVTPEGRRHVFSHIGSGTFAGADTYLSKFFVCNPILFNQEIARLGGLTTHIYVHRHALVTTPFDMLLNQLVENKRGARRHGSCGVGFNETIERDRLIRLRVSDLMNQERVCAILDHIVTRYILGRAAELGVLDEYENGSHQIMSMLVNFVRDCSDFISSVHITDDDCLGGKSILFEGAQGLMLDQNNSTDFPHLTRSNTGIRNAVEICSDVSDVDGIDVHYVTRTYLTRHGCGPLPCEVDAIPGTEDTTNVPHPFQGALRYAPLPNWESFYRRVADDVSSVSASGVHLSGSIALTCMDQVENHSWPSSLLSYGPTRSDVRERES